MRRNALLDGHGRTIRYLRLSLTDRCDLRCQYCMPQVMRFLPKADLLTAGEIDALVDRFVDRGVSRIRLTGGEPLVRKDFAEIAKAVSRRVGSGLEELTLTTNGTQLARYADMLAKIGVERINVSIDTLDENNFREITRGGDLSQVLGGVNAARRAGLAVKINMVALKGFNQDQLLPMVDYCEAHGLDLTLIEAMPLGESHDFDRTRFIALENFIAPLVWRHPLRPSPHRSSGPARYFTLQDRTLQLGLITPLSDNFCAGCDRIRLTANGRIYMCLGREDCVDLRSALRDGDPTEVDRLIDVALATKPKAHNFLAAHASKTPAVSRSMSMTGG